MANKSIVFTAIKPTYNSALDLIESDKADMIINIPKDFEKDFLKQRNQIFLLQPIRLRKASGSNVCIISDFARKPLSFVLIKKGIWRNQN